MADPDRVALRMERVSKRFPGTLAVDAVDFEVRAGEVHALMGENGAGKSTLMKMLAGSFSDYSGNIYVNGECVELYSPSAAIAHGVGMIYQELSLARPVSIAENLLAGRLPRKWGCVLDRPRLIARATELLALVGLDIDPMKTVDDISPHEAQLVEIARVLGGDPSVLVMDEPTSSLSREEVARLYEIILDLKNQGLAIVYISHHLNEIFEVADRVTVLRDGKWIASEAIESVTSASLVGMMIGQKVGDFYTPRKATLGAMALKATDLSRWGFFHEVSFSLRKGETVGIAGLAGSGRSELARALVGLDPLDAGAVELNGEALARGTTYPESIRRGMVYLSEDRKEDGLFLRLSVRENLVSAIIPHHSRRGMYSSGCEQADSQGMIEQLAIVTSSMEEGVNNLSGGNQQKALLGKWLLANPSVLILDEPSRGVDVNAKMKIHEAVIALADAGAAVILISSDLPELVGLSDRVAVLKAGRLIGELPKTGLNEERILLAMNGEFPDA